MYSTDKQVWFIYTNALVLEIGLRLLPNFTQDMEKKTTTTNKQKNTRSSNKFPSVTKENLFTSTTWEEILKMSYVSHFSGVYIIWTNFTTDAEYFIYKYGNSYFANTWTLDNFKDQI